MNQRKKPAQPKFRVKKPRTGESTVYFGLQYYSRDHGRTLFDGYARFNLYNDVSTLAPTLTTKGIERGYQLTPEHLAECKKWLSRNGKKAVERVPLGVRRKLQAEIETKVRAELNVGTSNSATDAGPAPSGGHRGFKPKTLGDKLSAMLQAIDCVKLALTDTAADQPLRLSAAAASDWRMCSFAFSEVLDLATEGKRGMGRPKAWQSMDWFDEADRRGYTTSKMKASRAASAKKAAASEVPPPVPSAGGTR